MKRSPLRRTAGLARSSALKTRPAKPPKPRSVPARSQGLQRGKRLAKQGARGKAREAVLRMRKLQVLERDGPGCRRCGSLRPPIDLHHLEGRGRGGSDEPSNLCLLCRPCHDGVTFQTLPDWRAWTR